MEPLVSVVIPVYNVEDYIAQCLETVVNQTYKNIEIIIVNDGSLDGSTEVIEVYAEKDERIKVINKKNGGLSDARNVGLRESTGDYIIFLDSDDYFELNMISRSVSKILLSKADVLIFNLFNEEVDLSGEIIRQNVTNIDLNSPASIVALIGYAWNKLYKAKFLKINQIYFEKGLSLVEDIVFNEKVFSKNPNVVFLDEPFYHYMNRQRPTLVKKYYPNSYELLKKGVNARKNVMVSIFGNSDVVKSLIAKSHLSGIRYCCSNMFFFINDLTFKEKIFNIKKMLNDNSTEKFVKDYHPVTYSEKVFKFLISKKMSLLLGIIYEMRVIQKSKL